MAAVLAGCAGPAAPQREDWPWGRTRRGLQSRIVFEKRVYKQGEPIVCWVEVRNASGKPVSYDARVGARVEVAGPSGHEPPGVQGRFCSIALVSEVDFDGRKPPPPYTYPTLKPHDVYRLGPYRLDGRYYLGEPGRYRLSWHGTQPRPAVEAEILDVVGGLMCGRERPEQERAAPPDVRAFPPAADAMVEVVPAPGGGPDGDIVGRLIRAMPPKWMVYDPRLLRDSVEPWGYKPGRGSSVGLVHMPESNSMENVAFLWVWVMAEVAKRDPEATRGPAKYLGRSKLGHVYIEPHVSDFGGPWPRWLHATHEIAVALEVENPPPKPDGPDWGRLVCRILRDAERAGNVSHGFWYLLGRGRATRGENELVRLELRLNLALTTHTTARERKEPGWPYYDVLFVVRHAKADEGPSACDKVVEWRTPAGTKVAVCWRIASDDAPFARALRAIFEGETRKFVTEQR